jgi:hypothetical protein
MNIIIKGYILPQFCNITYSLLVVEISEYKKAPLYIEYSGAPLACVRRWLVEYVRAAMTFGAHLHTCIDKIQY